MEGVAVKTTFISGGEGRGQSSSEHQHQFQEEAPKRQKQKYNGKNKLFYLCIIHNVAALTVFQL